MILSFLQTRGLFIEFSGLFYDTALFRLVPFYLLKFFLLTVLLLKINIFHYQVICSGNANFNSDNLVRTLYFATLHRLKTADIDQEVKERAITCMGQIMSSAGNRYVFTVWCVVFLWLPPFAVAYVMRCLLLGLLATCTVRL